MPARKIWRLILDDPEPAAYNMAVDRAIQLQVAEGSSPPTLRLYRWKHPTATIGRFQSASDVDLEYCRAHGIDVVRRFTGGRGVLHDDEITYSIIASTSDGVPKGTSASYKYLCVGLVAVYQRLGVNASVVSRDRGTPGSAACYLHATEADVALGPLKLSGSAQVWYHDTVMQHGSFVRSRDTEVEGHVFRLPFEMANRLATETTTLAEELGTPPLLGELLDAIVAGISEGLHVEFTPGRATDAELELAGRLEPETDVTREDVRASS